MANFSEMVSFIWSVADLLRGPYKPHQYGRVILPMTVLRRLDCVLEPTKQKVLEKHTEIKGQPEQIVDRILNRTAKQSFHNKSKLDFQKLKGDPDKVAANLGNYIKNFSANIRRIFEYFEFEKEIARMEEANVLYLVVRKFAEMELASLTNHDMGLVFEDLIRRFNEASNETAGDHFTPRDVIRLMVDLLFEPDRDVLHKKGIVRTLYDPACGTGGMLSVAEEYLRELNPDASLEVFGQDYNNEAFAICCSDMVIKGQDADNIKFGNSFTHDGHGGKRFDYLLANPPFGVKWEKEQASIEKEHEEKGMSGRFGAGLPRINDGALLFLQHMISKMKPEGARLAIVFNGSPLFTGDAGSGESEIRRWIIENDWLEAIVALPNQMFYNTDISTFLWIVTNRKRKERRGKVQLINAVELYSKLRRSLGDKRKKLQPEHISRITSLYGDFKETELSRILDAADFGYRQLTVERPLRLAFQVTLERIKILAESTAFQNLARTKKKNKDAQMDILAGRALQTQILKMLEGMDQPDVYKRKDAFLRRLAATTTNDGIEIPKAVHRAILGAMSARDETAEVCRDADGNPEPDPDARCYEHIALKEDTQRFFEEEIVPYLPDAWIAHNCTELGYEIPFAKYFFKYLVPRPIDDIDANITALQEQLISAIQARAHFPHGIPPKLKASDYDWLKNVPEHWNIVPLFTVVTEKNRTNAGMVESNLLSLSYGRIVRKDKETTEGLLPESFESYQIVEEGEIILRLTDLQNDQRSLRVGIAMERGIITSAYLNLSPDRSKVEPRFLFYQLSSADVQKVFYKFGGGVRQSMKYAELRRLPVAIPELSEQRRIIEFLDRETGKIDELIGAKNRPVDLVEEDESSPALRLIRALAEYRSALVAASSVGQIEIHYRGREAVACP